MLPTALGRPPTLPGLEQTLPGWATVSFGVLLVIVLRTSQLTDDTTARLEICYQLVYYPSPQSNSPQKVSIWQAWPVHPSLPVYWRPHWPKLALSAELSGWDGAGLLASWAGPSWGSSSNRNWVLRPAQFQYQPLGHGAPLVLPASGAQAC